MPGKRTELTPKQVEFIKAYIASSNARQSAITAGYSVGNATKTARALLKNPLVTEVLQKSKQRAIEEGEYTKRMAVEELDRRIEKADEAGQHSAVASLMQAKLRVTGHWVEKVDVRATGLVLNVSAEYKSVENVEGKSNENEGD